MANTNSPVTGSSSGSPPLSWTAAFRASRYAGRLRFAHPSLSGFLDRQAAPSGRRRGPPRPGSKSAVAGCRASSRARPMVRCCGTASFSRAVAARGRPTGRGRGGRPSASRCGRGPRRRIRGLPLAGFRDGVGGGFPACGGLDAEGDPGESFLGPGLEMPPTHLDLHPVGGDEVGSVPLPSGSPGRAAEREADDVLGEDASHGVAEEVRSGPAPELRQRGAGGPPR